MVFLDYAFPWLFALSMVILLLFTMSYSSEVRRIGKKAILAVWALGTFDLFIFSIYEGILSSDHTRILSLMVVGTLGSIISICLSFGYKGTPLSKVQQS